MINFILAQAGGGWQNIVFIVLMIAIFYFFMILPQQKKQKELRKFRDALKKGDEVLTNGGLFGTISSIEDDVVYLEVDKGVKIKVLKSALASTTSASETK